MTARSHTQMHRFIQLAADHRLTPAQQQALEAHLAGCADCRDYAAELKALETQLASVSVTRLVPPPSRATAGQVAAVQASYRRHTMKRQMLSAAGVLATIALVAVLILIADRIVPRGSSPAGAPTDTIDFTPFPTFTPPAEVRADQQEITEAEAQVGYPLKTLASLPSGYIFSRAIVHQPTNSVCLVYEYTRNDGYGPELWLAQGSIAKVPGLVPQQGFTETWQTPVSVGGAGEAYSLNGMMREGEWACGQPQDGSDPALRLTWQAAGQQYDLYALYGKCLLEEGLSNLDLLRLAEGMTSVPSHAADELDLECTKDIAMLESLAGYQVRLPADIIEMEFVGASYSGPPLMQILLYYKELGSNHAGLLIRQMPVNPELGYDLASQFRKLPEDGYQLLIIDGDPAVMILGDWTRGELGGYVWHQEFGFTPTFSYKSKGLLISFGGPWLADAGDKLQETLIAIAESMYSTPQLQPLDYFTRAESDTLPQVGNPGSRRRYGLGFQPEYCRS